MTGTKLSLPTDIPWRRICVSTDMLDPVTCDDERPPRWHSSLAAFRYDPVEDYQPFEDAVVSYVKVVATIAPFQWNEPGVTPRPDFVPEEIADDVEESHPCYGAVLQVGVSAPRGQQDTVSPEARPYFADFEPKKRELYEAVTDTGEVLSGSMSALSVGKAVTDTHATEDYNLDLGGGGGFGVGWGLIEANWSGQEQTGTVTRDTHQVQNVRSTDFSTERRELQSHTTQLTQMYNLFQAFHLGTNRAVFLIEPRPHLRQVESTFITGPRAIEGIQEVFLVVVRPKALDDFCVDALLETAHVTKTPIEEFAEKELYETFEVRFSFLEGPSPGEKTQTYKAGAGWEIDVDKALGGYNYSYAAQDDVEYGPAFLLAPDRSALTVTARVGPGGHLKLDPLVIYLKAKEKHLVEVVRKLFLTARELCCCPPQRRVKPGWVTSTVDVGRHRWRIEPGPGSPDRLTQSRHFAATVRDEMVRSFTSSRRHPRGALEYTRSDAFFTRIADLLALSRHQDALQRSLAETPELDDTARGQLYRALGEATVSDLLTAADGVLARALETDVSEVSALKERVLRAIARQPRR